MFFLAAPASAQERPVWTPARHAAAAPWTGFYLGGHAGYGWGNQRFTDNTPAFGGTVDAQARSGGGVFGLQAGYNHQIERLLLGVEATFSWSDVRARSFPCYSYGDQTCSAKSEWFATFAGRLGFATGADLFYVKGGAAWTQAHLTSLARCNGPQPTAKGGLDAACGDELFGNQTRIGWMIGAGLERWLMPSWSIRLEYNYMDFGRRAVRFDDGERGVYTEDIRQTISVVKAALNYHFDWRNGPTPAGVIGGPLAASGDAPSRGLAFTGFDVSKRSYGTVMGALIAPSRDIDASGLRVLIAGESGHYRYGAGSGAIRATYAGGEVLAGYAFDGANYTVNLLAGVNAVNHTLSAIDTENRVQGTAIGAKVRGDAWINPTASTLVFGEAEYATAFKTYYARGVLGYDIGAGRQIFLGPELAVMGTERAHQWRVGAHLAQLRFLGLQLGLSGGYARDSIVGGSVYSALELSANF